MSNTTDRKTEIKRLVKEGYSLAGIAREWGISRQRVHQLLYPDNVKEIKAALRSLPEIARRSQ